MGSIPVAGATPKETATAVFFVVAPAREPISASEAQRNWVRILRACPTGACSQSARAKIFAKGEISVLLWLNVRFLPFSLEFYEAL